MLGKWARVFGQESIVVRPYPEKHAPTTDIRRDFFTSIGLSEVVPYLTLQSRRANASLSRLGRLLIRVANELAVFPRITGVSASRRRRLVRIIEEITSRSAPPRRRKVNVAITLRFRESNDEVSRRYGVPPSYWISD
jgi:hypothetical protein